MKIIGAFVGFFVALEVGHFITMVSLLRSGMSSPNASLSGYIVGIAFGLCAVYFITGKGKES